MKSVLERAFTTVLAAGLTLVLLLAASYAWSRFSVENPLDQTLRAHQCVEGVRMESKEGVSVVTVALGEVDDLHETFEQVEAIVSSRMPPGSYRLEIEDTRTPELADLYHTVHFDIAEAIATGAFTRMSQNVEAKIASAGPERSRIWVSPGRIYLQIHHGDSYLYEVIERPLEAQ